MVTTGMQTVPTVPVVRKAKAYLLHNRKRDEQHIKGKQNAEVRFVDDV
jgi:hypothetical protein